MPCGVWAIVACHHAMLSKWSLLNFVIVRNDNDHDGDDDNDDDDDDDDLFYP